MVRHPAPLPRGVWSASPDAGRGAVAGLRALHRRCGAGARRSKPRRWSWRACRTPQAPDGR